MVKVVFCIGTGGAEHAPIRRDRKFDRRRHHVPNERDGWERKRPESSRVGVMNLTNISQIGEACEAHGASLASDKRGFFMTVSVKRRVPVPF